MVGSSGEWRREIRKFFAWSLVLIWWVIGFTRVAVYTKRGRWKRVSVGNLLISEARHPSIFSFRYSRKPISLYLSIIHRRENKSRKTPPLKYTTYTPEKPTGQSGTTWHRNSASRSEIPHLYTSKLMLGWTYRAVRWDKPKQPYDAKDIRVCAGTPPSARIPWDFFMYMRDKAVVRRGKKQSVKVVWWIAIVAHASPNALIARHMLPKIQHVGSIALVELVSYRFFKWVDGGTYEDQRSSWLALNGNIRWILILPDATANCPGNTDSDTNSSTDNEQSNGDLDPNLCFLWHACHPSAEGLLATLLSHHLLLPLHGLLSRPHCIVVVTPDISQGVLGLLWCQTGLEIGLVAVDLLFRFRLHGSLVKRGAGEFLICLRKGLWWGEGMDGFDIVGCCSVVGLTGSWMRGRWSVYGEDIGALPRFLIVCTHDGRCMLRRCGWGCWG